VNELYKVMAPEQSDEEKFLSAIASGNLNMVQEFVEMRGYDVNMRNSNGNTPLHVACFNGQSDVVQYFLQKGADPQATGQRNNTCLHYAAAKGHLELVKQFVQLGNNVLAKNERGKTPYDAAEGFGVKQFLMPLIFSEEQRMGTAPTIIGATVDNAREQERIANLPPPPKMGHSAYSDPNRREGRAPARQIQPDGFVTTVGNPELSAKYGNKIRYRSESPSVGQSTAPSAPATPPTYNPGVARNSPFSKARYVSYDAANNKVGAPIPYAPPSAGAGGAQPPPTAGVGALTSQFGGLAPPNSRPLLSRLRHNRR
ncbi:Sex-determining protein fem-1 (Feminization of XX and XO animals protein 1), partial [Durusdinium trenchii]